MWVKSGLYYLKEKNITKYKPSCKGRSIKKHKNPIAGLKHVEIILIITEWVRP